MDNEEPPLYPTVKMQTAINSLDEAVQLYNRGMTKQPGYGLEEYMEEVKRYLRWAISDINYAYGMIEPMPAGEPLHFIEGMEKNTGAGAAAAAAAEGGRRKRRSSTRRQHRSARRRHRSKRT